MSGDHDNDITAVFGNKGYPFDVTLNLFRIITGYHRDLVK